MTSLEKEVADLKRMLQMLEERVRLEAVAESFLRQEHAIREGDYFLLNGHHPTKLVNISDGRWTYHDGHNLVEPFRIPDPGDHERLYTIAEVAEILAKSARR